MAGRTSPTTIADRDTPIAEILRRLELGESMNAICKSPELPSRETMRKWVAEDPALAERIMDAREAGYMERAERAVEAAKNATDAQLGRLALDAERWALSKLSTVFAERPPRIESRTNLQVVNIDAGNPFGRLAEFLDSAAAAIAGGASSTKLVAGDSAPGPDNTAG